MALLLEDGSALLLEDGSRLLLEGDDEAAPLVFLAIDPAMTLVLDEDDDADGALDVDATQTLIGGV